MYMFDVPLLLIFMNLKQTHSSVSTPTSPLVLETFLYIKAVHDLFLFSFMKLNDPRVAH